MSDNDIENVMKNLKEVSKRFQSSFNSTIFKSTIRTDAQNFSGQAQSGHDFARGS
jgi:hypothetical protein